MKTKNGLKLNKIDYAPGTKIALTSAVYYKANFVYRFNPAQPGLFNTPSGQIQVDMMNMKRKFRWGKVGDIAEWVAIPYESEDSLIIILPNKNMNLENVIGAMNEDTFLDILYYFDRDSTNVRFWTFLLTSITLNFKIKGRRQHHFAEVQVGKYDKLGWAFEKNGNSKSFFATRWTPVLVRLQFSSSFKCRTTVLDRCQRRRNSRYFFHQH